MKTKFYWHIHHRILFEPAFGPIKNRIKYIKEHKSISDIPLRLKFLKPVKGKLPDEVIKAGKAYLKAWEAYMEAGEAYVEAREAYVEAWKVYIKTLNAYYKALKKYDKQIEALHKKECPNCPWNGHSIFGDYRK